VRPGAATRQTSRRNPGRRSGSRTESQHTPPGLDAQLERIRLLLGQAPAVLWTVDSELRFTTMEGSVLPRLGLDPDRSLGQSIQDLLGPGDEVAVPAHRRALEGEQVSYQLEHSGRVLDARVEPFLDDKGKIIGVVGAAFDITDRVSTERALRESEERYRRLFNEGLTGNCVVTVRGTVIEGNPAFARLFGFASIDEALSSSVPELVPDRALRRSILRRLVQEHRLDGVEIEARTRSGQTLHLIANLAVTPAETEGAPEEIRAYLFDDTARRSTELQLRQAQKMEAVGRLSGGVAHDFNNLITAISGYSDLCLTSLPEDAQIRPYLEEIKRAGERGASLAQHLLAFSRLQVLRPEPLHLNRVVHGVESMLDRLIGEHIRIVTELAPALPPVTADPRQVEQILVNLALNARDAMERGGTLTFSTRLIELTPADVEDYEFVVPPGPYVCLTVCDTGTGMTDEVRKHAFEPFFTTKGPGKGSGLGLSTVYGIVKQTGGFITLDNDPAGGARIEIILPRATEQPHEKPADSHGPDPGASHGRETLLVVEDEAPLRKLLTEILSRLGYTVLEAGNGREAMEVSNRFPGHIHLLVTDVVMPDMRGPELDRRLRESRSDTRVLFISGYPGDDVIVQGELSQRPPFLQKPFDQATLARTVREVLDGRS